MNKGRVSYLASVLEKPRGKKVKFRTLYEYDPSRDQWAFQAIDMGDATEDRSSGALLLAASFIHSCGAKF
jgi:hypothetical protein